MVSYIHSTYAMYIGLHGWTRKCPVAGDYYKIQSNQIAFNSAGCLTLLEILEIYWKIAKSPGNFLADSKFLYFTVYQLKRLAVNQD